MCTYKLNKRLVFISSNIAFGINNLAKRLAKFYQFLSSALPW